MRVRTWRSFGVMLVGAALAAGLFGAYYFLGWIWPALAPGLLGSVVLAALTAGCAAGLAAGWIGGHYRHIIRQAKEKIAAAALAGERSAEAGRKPQKPDSAPSKVSAPGTRERPREPAQSPLGPPAHFIGSSRHRMVVRLAPNLEILALTLPIQQFLGLAGAELANRSFLDLVQPEDRPLLARSFKDALKEGEGHDIRFRVAVPFVPKDEGPGMKEEGGQESPSGRSSILPPSSLEDRHLLMDVMTCFDETGTPQHLRCHLLDVTERVRTEQELVRSTREAREANARLRQTNEDLERLKESYRDLYHHAPVIYFSLDAGGRLAAFNETMLRTLGYVRDDLLGQPYARLLPPASRAQFLADPSPLQRPGELETRWVKKDGTIIDVWIGTTTIRDLRGGFVRSRSAARDVTERNRLATSLRSMVQEVGRANSHLRRINQELEEFTYVVSHDLKEPLRTLEAFSNFLFQDYGPVLGGEGKEYINHLIGASRRLGTLIDDLLMLSRAGRVINTPRPFFWEETVATVLGDLHDLIGRKSAAVRVEGTLPAVVGDRERIVQLLTNLVSNGLKYNQASHPEVVIGAAPSPEEDGPVPPSSNPDLRLPMPGTVTLYVRDNGVGIDPAYHEQIFRIFRRLVRREQVEGTGAGLAICKKVVEAHGGRIWVDSAAGKGSTFYFTLPVHRPVEGPSRPMAAQGGAGTELRAAPATTLAWEVVRAGDG
jgi:PAS domain S-box-containing protein